MNSNYIAMDKLPVEITRIIYDYDPTYRELFDKSLKRLRCYCFIYRCSECFKPYNRCFCYCVTCGTYLRFCRQIYYDQDSVYEDDLNDVIQLGFDLNG